MVRADKNDNADKPLCPLAIVTKITKKSTCKTWVGLGVTVGRPLIKSHRLTSNSSRLQFGVSLDKTLTLLSGQH